MLQQEEDLAPAVDLQQRDREITEIARSIAQLAELFKDLSALVIDQGTLLDSVEYNIEQTAVEMQEAVTELKIAEGYVSSVCLFVSFVPLFVCFSFANSELLHCPCAFDVRRGSNVLFFDALDAYGRLGRFLRPSFPLVPSILIYIRGEGLPGLIYRLALPYFASKFL